jgi:hypothetical protein
MRTHLTQSKKREPVTDTCPSEYLVDRNELDSKHYVRVNEHAKKRLATKFGVDKFGRVNAHFADLCELEMLDGRSVYEGFINEYLNRSGAYLKNHPQKKIEVIQDNLLKLVYLQQAYSKAITQTEADEFSDVLSCPWPEEATKSNQFNLLTSF